MRETWQRGTEQRVLRYSCQIDSRRIFGKAWRFIVESFSPNSAYAIKQNPDLINETDKEVDKILEKYMTYTMVVAVYEQSFPQWILFNQELQYLLKLIL